MSTIPNNPITAKNKTRKQKGQGLIEYLILVALMGVATIGVIRVLNQTIKARFASAVYALQGKPKKVKTDSLKAQDYTKSDLSNFMNGAASKDKGAK
jgi:Flp pilus assembly pilin Flp